MAGARVLSRRQGLMLLAATAASGPGQACGQTDPAPSAVQGLLNAQIDPGRQSLGYVAGVSDAAGLHVITAGHADASGGRTLDGDTVFEIGSVTKVFTALLLADMAQRGEVALTDPVENYLPPEGRPVRYDGKPISLLDLATYTSGLPRMPGNIPPGDPANPYATYSVAQLYAFLSSYQPKYYPGSHYEYANLGFGLLGHVLARHAGRSYEDLVVTRICAPLGLDSTRITLTGPLQNRLAPGHDAALHQVANWDLPVMAGAGALRSTANDLLRFVRACQGVGPSPLAAAMASLLEVRRQTEDPYGVAAAGWFVATAFGDELVWKDGGTGGYSSFIGYSPRTGAAAVLLSNTASDGATGKLGRHLINAAFPLPAVR